VTIVRYAPSPTGRLHLGNLRPALLNWLFARRRGGRFILRFDDTDFARSTREFADAIEEDLRWIGIEPDEVVRQSERSAQHDAARDRLIADGRLYACYETPEELDRRRARARAMGRPPIYDRAALSLTGEDIAKLEAQRRRPHWRFRLDGRLVSFTDLIRGEHTVDTSSMSDPVLIREDGTYLYTLPSVVDDIELGVTHVIRGEDHLSNTGVQIELIEALGATPPVFAHHNLLVDSEGQGFSKRLGSTSLADLREAGYEPMAIAAIAALTGTSLPIEAVAGLAAMGEALEFSMISHGPARTDMAELDQVNAKIVHDLPFEDVADRVAPLGVTNAGMWEALRANISRVPEIAEWVPLVTGPITPLISGEDRDFVNQARELLPQEPWSGETWNAWTGALKQATGRKGKSLFLPLRLALTGRPDGPELRNLLPLLGRKVCLDRLS
jgi:glutamyl-tRNA synthetase